MSRPGETDKQVRYMNKTPYAISYKKSRKVLPNTPFLSDEPIDITEIEVWYGGEWMHRPQIFLDGRSVFYKRDQPVHSPNSRGSGDVLQLLKSSGVK